MQTYLTFDLEGSEETLFIDATPVHSPSFSSKLTEHPVEGGSDISDHSRPEPERVSFEFVISDAPTKGATGGTTNPTDTSDRARFSFELLNSLRVKGTLFTVVTGFRAYRNMAISNLSPTVSASVAGAVRFRADFQEIKVVDSKTVEIRIPKRVSKAKPTADLGKQNGKVVKDEDGSILSGLIDKGFVEKSGPGQ